MSAEVEALPGAPGRFTKITKGLRRDLVAQGLPAASLEIVRNLAAEGCREHVIRSTIGLSPQEWRALLKADDAGDLSPLRLALEEGHAQGAGEVIAVMRTNMRAGDTKAAAWLGEKVYKIGAEDGNTDAPRVSIFINAALSVEEYGRVVSVQKPA